MHIRSSLKALLAHQCDTASSAPHSSCNPNPTAAARGFARFAAATPCSVHHHIGGVPPQLQPEARRDGVERRHDEALDDVAALGGVRVALRRLAVGRASRRRVGLQWGKRQGTAYCISCIINSDLSMCRYFLRRPPVGRASRRPAGLRVGNVKVQSNVFPISVLQTYRLEGAPAPACSRARLLAAGPACVPQRRSTEFDHAVCWCAAGSMHDVRAPLLRLANRPSAAERSTAHIQESKLNNKGQCRGPRSLRLLCMRVPIRRLSSRHSPPATGRPAAEDHLFGASVTIIGTYN